MAAVSSNTTFNNDEDCTTVRVSNVTEEARMNNEENNLENIETALVALMRLVDASTDPTMREYLQAVAKKLCSFTIQSFIADVQDIRWDHDDRFCGAAARLVLGALNFIKESFRESPTQKKFEVETEPHVRREISEAARETIAALEALRKSRKSGTDIAAFSAKVTTWIATAELGPDRIPTTELGIPATDSDGNLSPITDEHSYEEAAVPATGPTDGASSLPLPNEHEEASVPAAGSTDGASSLPLPNEHTHEQASQAPATA